MIVATLHPGTPSIYRHPQANREAWLASTHVAYRFQRGRRRSIGFVIGPEGLEVRAPTRVALREVDAALQEKAAWIARKLTEVQQRQGELASARITWKNGVLLPFLGAPVKVVLDPQRPKGATLVDAAAAASTETRQRWLKLGLPETALPEQIRDAAQSWLQRQARRVFDERLRHYAPQLGVQWQRLALSNASTRWGSASSSGHIRLNWRLIHFRQPVIDYVVVHELSHLRVMDHSPRFWATVESVMPDYAALRAELKVAVVPRWD